MKNFWTKLAVICMLCSFANVVIAKEKSTCKLNVSSRLKKIRARLDQFQKQNKKSTVKKACDSVELKIIPEKINFEKISLNFETREDVKVITLFHDPAFDNNKSQDIVKKEKIVTIDDLRQKFKQNTFNTKLRASRIREMVAEIR